MPTGANFGFVVAGPTTLSRGGRTRDAANPALTRREKGRPLRHSRNSGRTAMGHQAPAVQTRGFSRLGMAARRILSSLREAWVRWFVGAAFMSQWET